MAQGPQTRLEVKMAVATKAGIFTIEEGAAIIAAFNVATSGDVPEEWRKEVDYLLGPNPREGVKA